MGLFTKSSPKKKTEPDLKENKSSSSRSSPRKSSTKSPSTTTPTPTTSSSRSPTKSLREKDQTSYKKGSWSRSSKRTHYSPDIHPLNLPPDERDRRRSAMSSDGEQDDEMQMDVDSDASGPYQHTNGLSDHEQMTSDPSPIPPPHKTPSPPPKPTYDPEVCKATGNKYFKAQDYTKAVQEYTKGERSIFSLH